MLFSFAKDESGALSFDWLVLSAVIVALGAGSAAVVLSNAAGAGGQLGAGLSVIARSSDPLHDYSWRAHDPDATHWWTNMELRSQHYHGLTDSQLQLHWTRHQEEFSTAVDIGDNSNCFQCMGAGNRLDSMYITHQIRVARGFASDRDTHIMRNAIIAYDQIFGN